MVSSLTSNVPVPVKTLFQFQSRFCSSFRCVPLFYGDSRDSSTVCQVQSSRKYHEVVFQAVLGLFSSVVKAQGIQVLVDVLIVQVQST